MERDSQQDWGLLQDEALRTVRAGATGSQRGFRVAQFVTLPSFTPCDSLDIRQVAGAVHVVSVSQPSNQHQEPGQYVVVRTRWRMDIDEQKLETPFKVPAERFRHRGPPKPTIETETRALSPEWADAIRQRLGTLAVPIPLELPIPAADDTYYELRAGSLVAEMTLRWSSEPPPGWAPLVSAFHEIVAELNQEFAAV